MHGQAVKLLLADDSELLCKAIRSVLSEEPTIKVLGEARTLRQTIDMASNLKPNVVLLDLHLPDGGGVEPSRVKTQLLRCSDRIVAMSLADDDEAKALAKAYGALVLLDKMNLGTQLVPTLLGVRGRSAA